MDRIDFDDNRGEWVETFLSVVVDILGLDMVR